MSRVISMIGVSIPLFWSGVVCLILFYKVIPIFPASGRLDTFLGKITRNLSLDRWRALRAQKRWQGQAELALTELGDCMPASSGVEQEVEAAALAESLNRFLESLPQEKRVLFVRRYWYLCSVEELAAWSGRRRGTVSAALFRLRQDLQEHLEREGFTL